MQADQVKPGQNFSKPGSDQVNLVKWPGQQSFNQPTWSFNQVKPGHLTNAEIPIVFILHCNHYSTSTEFQTNSKIMLSMIICV